MRCLSPESQKRFGVKDVACAQSKAVQVISRFATLLREIALGHAIATGLVLGLYPQH